MPTTLEVRDDGHSWSLKGLATTWSGTYYVSDLTHGTFLEKFERGSFQNAVRGDEDVELRREHDADGDVYAATSLGSLRLEDVTPGLSLAATLAKSHGPSAIAARDIQAGVLKGLSVGFKVLPGGDRWGLAGDGRTALRTIKASSLREVSMVRRPSNYATSLEVRSANPDIEFRYCRLVWNDVPVHRPARSRVAQARYDRQRLVG